ncbi:acyl-CoA thioesterase [Ruixingdingia sedimenti]|uniref:Thioesterase family protein n=1 Tax=Ruixingdingia sedimenti TaxID=3073604 RepID=A0ABU1F9N8_9RHOB|nr:thioesterase family protein [Xinfangfangia sp. LG-4]MDR5653600.1 thioesterase family protein [Xinfangfangia sp. LG-4]
MSYVKVVPIEFNHCDPAGIVFYPRYFEMINSVVENFFADVVGCSFAQMHAEGHGNGVPTVHLDCDFRAPSRLGDKVPFTLVVRAVGRSSLTMDITAGTAGDERLSAGLKVVWIKGGRAAPWPDALRARLEEELAKGDRDGQPA